MIRDVNNALMEIQRKAAHDYRLVGVDSLSAEILNYHNSNLVISQIPEKHIMLGFKNPYLLLKSQRGSALLVNTWSTKSLNYPLISLDALIILISVTN